MEEKENVNVRERSGRVMSEDSPMPALEVIMVLAKLHSGAGSQRNAMANSLFTVFGEDFKVRALPRNFLRNFRNFVEPEKMAF